jgi:membrane associated rhomboid family serine protease
MPFIPLHDKTPRVLIKVPWVTWGLIIACALIYLLELDARPGEVQRLMLGLGMIPAALTGQAELSAELSLVPPIATLVTHQFLHGGVLHLGLNMAYLWVFGDNVEDAMGHLRFLLFYLLCGAIAALAEVVSAPGQTTPLIGASGAISGVLGAYLVLHPNARVLVPIVIIPLYLPAYLLLLLWIGFQIYAVMAIPDVARDGVAWWAHIGGFVADLLLIVPFRHKAIPLWQSRDLPSGIEMTVRDSRPQRRDDSGPDERQRRGDRLGQDRLAHLHGNDLDELVQGSLDVVRMFVSAMCAQQLNQRGSMRDR